MKKSNYSLILFSFFLLLSSCLKQPGMNYLNHDPYPVIATLPTSNNENIFNIGMIQGGSHTSPYLGEFITELSGIVTAVRENGFYLQSIKSDDNIYTSDGIFIHLGKLFEIKVKPGDYLLVSGRVDEFYPGGAQSGNLSITQIEAEEILLISHNNKLPEPIIIGNKGFIPPDKTIDGDNMSEFNYQDSIDFYEIFEGMLVQVDNPVVVGPTDQYGQIVILGDEGFFATGRNSRGGLSIRNDDFNPERLILDDVILNLPDVKVGDRFKESIIGIMDYSFGNYKILPIKKLVPIDNRLERQIYSRSEEASFTIATYNVENLSPLDETGRFKQLAKDITNHLGLPDIIALQEIQDNNGFINDDVISADLTFKIIIEEINKLSNVKYQYIDISPLDDLDGGMEGANIRVGFLYRADRKITIQKSGFLSPNPFLIGKNNKAFFQSRKPLIVEFILNEESIFIINNHWVSKSSDQSLFGKNQPPNLISENQRLEQANAVKEYIFRLLNKDEDTRIIVLGDMNDYYFSKSVKTLEKDTGLVNLIEQLPIFDRYNYIFEGNSQNLDNVLISQSLVNYFQKIDIVHINSEFPLTQRMSDHDPIIITFQGILNEK